MITFAGHAFAVVVAWDPSFTEGNAHLDFHYAPFGLAYVLRALNTLA